ncbi:MAG: NusG domain II-containing protein [Desulfuromonadales bacterium]|nr:NusG domain II-containing protein [Desulfuromonadales bacterium]
MTSLWACMTGADRLLTLALTLFALAGAGWLLSAPPGERILVDDGVQIVYQGGFDRVAELSFHGPMGTSRLAIAADGVRVIEAPCPQKLCMGMGPARRSGDLIACLPNRLLVRIVGAQPAEAVHDLISR